MSTGFHFEHRTEFQPDRAEDLLRAIPASPGVFALRGERENAQPYLTRAADLRRRLRRLLLPAETASFAELPNPSSSDGVQNTGAPPSTFSKRLNLRALVRSVEWTETGSEFESTLLLYHATRSEFGPERARERLKLRPPFVVRLTTEHEHPRLYVTNRLGRQAMHESFGPFPSRAAAERYAEAVGDLFKLRRCHEDLVVHPDHPGCAYGEMKLCLAPCKAAVPAAEYNDEAARAHEFLISGGASLLAAVANAREGASEALDFEAAATLHVRWEKVKGAAALADDLVRPVSELRALILQEAAPQNYSDDHAGRVSEAAVFLLEAGRLVGPERLSTLGVRAVREQTAVGSSLFAQPLMLSARPLDQSPATSSTSVATSLQQLHSPPGMAFGENPPAGTGNPEAINEPGANAPALPEADSTTMNVVALSPEERASRVLGRLHERAGAVADLEAPPSPADLSDTLALFRRWYYRPEKQRSGEVFLPNPDGSWPVRRLLNGAARVVLGPPSQLSPVDREAARELAREASKASGTSPKPLKTRVLHPGREGVERVVPVMPKRSRMRKTVLPNDVVV